MQPISSKAAPHWRECLHSIRVRLSSAQRVLIASDFDGTLSPIVDHAGAAQLHFSAPDVLRELAGLNPRVRLAFLSGRGINDLEDRLGPAHPGTILAGNHGLELRGAGLDWVHPACASSRPALDILTEQLIAVAMQFEEAEIEDKGASVTLHYRRVNLGEVERLKRAISALELPESVRIHEGKMVMEFRPNVVWNKGLAIRRIIRRIGIPPAATVYMGDDVTDEDVFQELRPTGITIRVGHPQMFSHASFVANDPSDAVEFLAAVGSLLQHARQ